jgi:phospholipid N-methyltransferase
VELDKFWTEEMFRAIEALKMRRVDLTDFEHWRSFHANLVQTIESWKVLSGDAQTLRRHDARSSKVCPFSLPLWHPLD